MEWIYALVSGFSTYKIWNFFTHPDSKIWQSFPQVKTKRVEVFPSIKIFVKGRTVHFHHWLGLSALLCVSIFVTGGILDSWITRGAIVGGIVQGLSIPSARKVIYR